jgi:hypothetical protein
VGFDFLDLLFGGFCSACTTPSLKFDGKSTLKTKTPVVANATDAARVAVTTISSITSEAIAAAPTPALSVEF